MIYRKDIRLKGFDYRASYWYFVTVCTKDRERLFVPRVSKKYGELLHRNVAAGPWPAECINNTNIVEEKIHILEEKFPVTVDFYCVMPNHIHVILALQARQGRAATNTTHVSWVMNAFKGWCTRSFNRRIFQPNYYDHIIRNDDSLHAIRTYILNNPLADDIKWNRIDPDI